MQKLRIMAQRRDYEMMYSGPNVIDKTPLRKVEQELPTEHYNPTSELDVGHRGRGIWEMGS